MSRMAEILWNWGPRVRAAGDLDLPNIPDWSLTQWADSPDSSTRIELSASRAPRFRRMFGGAGSISQCEADDSATPYKFEVVAKLLSRQRDEVGAREFRIYILTDRRLHL